MIIVFVVYSSSDLFNIRICVRHPDAYPDEREIQVPQSAALRLPPGGSEADASQSLHMLCSVVRQRYLTCQRHRHGRVGRFHLFWPRDFGTFFFTADGTDFWVCGADLEGVMPVALLSGIFPRLLRAVQIRGLV